MVDTTAIRRMTAADLSVVHAIECMLHPDPWSLEIFENCLKKVYECWVLEDTVQSEIIGYIMTMLHVDEEHIINFGIAPSRQRQGHGQHLLSFAIARAKGLGATKIILEVRMSNEAAIALYEKMGFLQISIRKDYYRSKNGVEHALVYLLQWQE